jgi:hypothetical protein
VAGALFAADDKGAPADSFFSRLFETPEVHLEEPLVVNEPEVLPCGLFLDGAPQLVLIEDPPWSEGPYPRIETNGHYDKQGNWVEYDHIRRRPGRPQDYEAYRYPVAQLPGWGVVASGYDLDKPDDEQRRGKMKAVGHGGVDLAQLKGAPIHLIVLSHQVGPAEVLFVGKLYGETVVTRHTLREGGRKANYLLFFSHLDEPAPGLWRGRMLRQGELVGFVGDSDSPDFVHLHLEARRVRDGIDPSKLSPERYLARDATVVTDPRNVLPLRAKPRRGPSCKQRIAEKRAKWLGEYELKLDPSLVLHF